MTDMLSGLGRRSDAQIPAHPRETASGADSAPPIAAPQAESHRTPVLHVETQSGLATLEFLDRSTGEVIAQSPDPDLVKKLVANYGVTSAQAEPRVGNVAQAGNVAVAAQVAATVESEAKPKSALSSGKVELVA